MNLRQYESELLELYIELCKIPSPTYHEDQKLAYIANWYADNGLYNFELDNEGNVLYKFNVTATNRVKIVTAHVDTVFSMDTNYTPDIRDGNLYCPGAGDNTANVAIMMMTVKALEESGYEPSCGVIFAADICEEGLGNLKGIKAIINDYSTRVEEVIGLDLAYGTIINKAVGSRRYSVDITTKGGHSYLDFGNKNAIAVASEIITKLYSEDIPDDNDTTYNVGCIKGGTGVNVIAANVNFLYEVRSTNFKNILAQHDKLMDLIVEYNKQLGVNVKFEILGERPGMGNVSEHKCDELMEKCLLALRNPMWEELGYRGEFNIISGSTDCNIPLSKGIPAICIGLAYSENHHTLSEWAALDSLLPGLETLYELFADV